MNRGLAAALVLCLGVALPGAAPALAAGGRGIAIVIQLGEGEQSIIDLCIHEPQGVTGAQALADGLRDAGLAQPTYATTGLLCSIAGHPATGCGVHAASGYQYWSYFHGSSSGWTYASDGPGTHVASPDAVEGWRFQSAGTGHPNDPAPVVDANPAAICAASRASQPAPTTTTSPPDTTLPAGGVASSTSTPTTSTTTTAPAPTTVPVGKVAERRRIAADARSSAQPPSGSPWGTVGAGAILIGLLGFSLVLWRRRTR